MAAVGPVRVGCSGWQYAHWRGRLYPEELPRRRWLARYAELFDTVEVNATFYRLARPEAVAGWLQQTPPGFLFAVKGSRCLTHMKRLADRERGLDRFSASIAPLAASPKLGPVLWTLPPTLRRDDGRLDAWLAAVARHPGRRHAIEFRRDSWFCEDVDAILRAHGAALAIGDDGRGPLRLVVTADSSDVRLHRGRRGRDGSSSDRELREWAARVRDLASHGEVDVSFNNDQEGFAVADARRLIGLLRR
jgi:uncharacterized protein YecE (DUF72 family)